MARPLSSAAWHAWIMLGIILNAAPSWAAEDPTPPPKPPPKLQQAPPKGAEPPPEEPPRKAGTPEPGATKTVASVQVTVKLALVAEPRLFPYPIEVTTDGQAVVLHGKVPSDAEASLAVTTAKAVPGVTGVTNKLEVSKDIKQVLSHKQDETITAYLKERFDRSTTLKTAGFSIKTEDGVVQLSGKTRFQVIALEAAETARQVPGVRAVRADDVRIESGD